VAESNRGPWIIAGAVLLLTVFFVALFRGDGNACTSWQLHYQVIVERTNREGYYGIVTKGPFGEVEKLRPPGCPIPTR
jgi:hypothetical protein